MIGNLISDKYEVLEELGRGGMGRVYKVYHRGLDQVFALKTLREVFAEEEQLLSRFHDEARIMAQLRHPNIVRVFDIDKDGAHYYFVMDYIEGDTLDALLEQQEKGCLSVAETIRISNEIADALIYSHAQQPAVVHRDIKPSNIMLERHSGKVIVTDFGIAKVLDQDRTQLTQAGFMIGTPDYASPEQLRSEQTLDGRADIFSLGLVIYEMLAGKKFFEDMSAEEIIGLKLFDPRELIPQFEKEVPEPLQQIITRAIAKDREQRYPSVQALSHALSQSVNPNVREPSSKWPALLALAVVTAVILGAGLWFYHQPQLDSDRLSKLDTKPETETETKPETKTEPFINQPPVLIGWLPKVDKVEISVGQEQLFSIEAVDIEEDPNLRYQWLLDEQPVSDSANWQFRANADTVGEHMVVVLVSDTKGAETRHHWSVKVITEQSDSTMTTEPKAQESEVSSCESQIISEAEVNQWLAQYQQALSDQDVDTLKQLGAPYSDQALEQLQKRERYEPLIQGVNAVADETTVKLKFEQVDRWYDAKNFSMVVDYVNRDLLLIRQGCDKLIVRIK